MRDVPCDSARFCRVRIAKPARSTPRPAMPPYCESPATSGKMSTSGVRTRARNFLPICDDTITALDETGHEGSPDLFQMFQYMPPFHCVGSSSRVMALVTIGK
eukprot:9466966-Pyramimonas_sp.AAC.1